MANLNLCTIYTKNLLNLEAEMPSMHVYSHPIMNRRTSTAFRFSVRLLAEVLCYLTPWGWHLDNICIECCRITHLYRQILHKCKSDQRNMKDEVQSLAELLPTERQSWWVRNKDSTSDLNIIISVAEKMVALMCSTLCIAGSQAVPQKEGRTNNGFWQVLLQTTTKTWANWTQ